MCACVAGAFNLTDGKIRDALLHKNGKQMNRESKKFVRMVLKKVFKINRRHRKRIFTINSFLLTFLLVKMKLKTT